MRRIPTLDVFGTPRSMGFVPPQTQGPDNMPSGTPLPPEAPPRMETSLRFEIRDVDENYIPGIGVSLVSENGTHLYTGALSDAGGNVGISSTDLGEAVEETIRQNPGIQKQKIYAVLQGPGYEPAKVLVFDPAVNQAQMARMHEVTMQKASESGGISPVVAVLGAAAALGAIYLALKG